MPRVRLIILNWNSGADTIRAVEHLHRLDWPADRLDVVVVDNASTDDSVAVLEARFPDLDLQVLPTNTGFAGNNAAMGDLDGIDFVGLVNNDAFCTPGYLQPLVDALTADPALGAVCPKILLEARFVPIQLDLDMAGTSSLMASGNDESVTTTLTRVTDSRGQDITSRCHVAAPVETRIATEAGETWFSIVGPATLWVPAATIAEGNDEPVGRAGPVDLDALTVVTLRFEGDPGAAIIIDPGEPNRNGSGNALGSDHDVVEGGDTIDGVRSERARERAGERASGRSIGGASDAIEVGQASVLQRAVISDNGIIDCPVTSRVLPCDVIQNIGTEMVARGYGRDRGYLEPDVGQHDTPTEVFGWCGAGVLFRPDYLRQVGLFDERFFLYYEDLDLSWRGRGQGWKYQTVPTSVMRHAHASSTVQGSPSFTRYQVRNRLIVVAKNASPAMAARTVVRSSGRTVLDAFRAVRGGPTARASLANRLRAQREALAMAPSVLRDRQALGRRRQVSSTEIDRLISPD